MSKHTAMKLEELGFMCVPAYQVYSRSEECVAVPVSRLRLIQEKATQIAQETVPGSTAYRLANWIQGEADSHIDPEVDR